MTTLEYLEQLGIDTMGFENINTLVYGGATSNTIQESGTYEAHSDGISMKVSGTLKCIVVSEQVLSDEALALLDKMLGAIHITPDAYQVVEELPHTEYKVAFFLDKHTYQAKHDTKHFYLIHPEHILVHPELKREAWETLKRVKGLISMNNLQ